MSKPIGKITVVGGGTSGWLAALFFSTRFARELASGRMAVELIESPRLPPIGVGESLSPSMPETLKDLGISERAFFQETDATFKLAGYFLDWERPAEAGGSSWINPFVGYLTAGYEFERFELRRTDGAPRADYAATISPCRDAIERCIAPRRLGDSDYTSVLRYAYHTDASRLAMLLRRHAVERGVKHVLADVEGATLDERGFVTSLRLAGEPPHPVELIIDATGFQSAILHRGLGVPLRDYSRYLLNDRAVVVQLASEPGAEIEPATRSTAIRQGWCFRVPLATRTGNGYIYSGSITDDDEAARDFASHLGLAEPDERFRVIPMRIGRAERTWEKNCIAIGLSAGFVEPLESSAIYSVETSLKWIFNYFPDADFEPALAERYNSRTAALYDEIVDYIVLHYHLAKRDDHRYWRVQRNDMAMTDRLAENLKLWRKALPVRGDVQPCNYFDQNTYISALFGKGFYPGASLKPERDLDPAAWAETKTMIANTHRRALAALPGHRALVESLRR
jgi:hypothetical protein